MKIPLLGLYTALYASGLAYAAYYVHAGITTWIGVWEPVAAATLLIVVIGQGMTSPDRPRSFNRINH